MLIDCDTCTARGTGCADCVVTVLLGAPPGWQGVDPVVVPDDLPARSTSEGDGTASASATAEDVVVPPPGVVVEFDEVERRAVRALADVGLVPPLRHCGHPTQAPGRAPDTAAGPAETGLGRLGATRNRAFATLSWQLWEARRPGNVAI